MESVSSPDPTEVVVGLGSGLMFGYLNSAVTMYAQGHASRDDIDAAMMLGCGLSVGPLRQLDLIGLDVAHDCLTALHARGGDPHYAPAPLLTRLVSERHLGSRSGRGFYSYDEAGNATATESVPEAGATAAAVRRVGVLGSGTMATGIAQVCAQAGFPTVLSARTEVRAKEALAVIDRSLARAVRRGRLSVPEHDAAISRLSPVVGAEGLAECDLVIEAVAENLDIKQQQFRLLDLVCAADAVLATTTSSLPVVGCADATRRPERVLGLHFFNPAPRMRLVELVPTASTSPGVRALARDFCARLGRHVVDCPDRAGFIVNALLFPYLNRAAELVGGGHATAGEIDAEMSGRWGFPLGPLQLLDVVGLDVALAIQDTLHRAFDDPHLAPADALRDLVAAGRLGRKTGTGFHTHQRP